MDNDSTPIRVMIVDDHDMVRRGLAAILRVTAGLEMVGEARNGKEALQVYKRVQPDVILMDLVMPEMDGATATHAIRERDPQIQVIALTSFKEKDLVQRAIEAGAIGYLLKNVCADELAEAIRAAYAGRATLAPEVAQALVQAEKLECLARDIVDAAPDATTLPDLLRKHVPGMFLDSRIEIRLLPDQTVLHHPADWAPVSDVIWAWLYDVSEAQCFLPGVALPWGASQPADVGLVTVPIVGIESAEPMGGIYVSRCWDPGAIADLLPVAKSLAAQIASALHAAQIHAQTVAHEKVARELAIAGRIQASFLPDALPAVAGWQLAATLEPARETSGDFYDFIPLPGARLGMVVADVADKGIGAALYMALSRTLIRTYADEYPERPDLVLDGANRRMLSDARAGLFVTVFYGVLDPATGTLVYCNAGHHPPYVMNSRNPDQVQAIHKTGMALGVVEDQTWEHKALHLQPGDLLVLYSDGIIDAQDQHGNFFGRERLVETLQANAAALASQGPTAQDIQNAVLAEVHQFTGEAPQSDDMTLMVVLRDLKVDP
jgi:serine phosphatase RsbU (regulator of sigma subunit)/DNA-binding NarL/FixJ family response regulator